MGFLSSVCHTVATNVRQMTQRVASLPIKVAQNAIGAVSEYFDPNKPNWGEREVHIFAISIAPLVIAASSLSRRFTTLPDNLETAVQAKQLFFSTAVGSYPVLSMVFLEERREYLASIIDLVAEGLILHVEKNPTMDTLVLCLFIPAFIQGATVVTRFMHRAAPPERYTG